MDRDDAAGLCCSVLVFVFVVVVVVVVVVVPEGLKDRGSAAAGCCVPGFWIRGLNWKRDFGLNFPIVSFSFSVRPLIACSLHIRI